MLTIGRPGSVFVIGVNKVHYQALEFSRVTDSLTADGVISPVEIREIPMYSKSDHEHSGDFALVLVFRKR